MSGYVVAVEFDIRPEAFAAFKPLMLENAQASLRDEPGCRQFDVSVPVENPARIFLYEIYDDEAAFKAHVASPHYKRFAAATKEMIAERRVTFCKRL